MDIRIQVAVIVIIMIVKDSLLYSEILKKCYKRKLLLSNSLKCVAHHCEPH